jgi:HKD family nuclease
MHIPLKCPEMKKQREELVGSKWLNINEDIAYRKIISCTNVTMTKTNAKYLFKGRPKVWGTP